jgi:hypothetical protein
MYYAFRNFKEHMFETGANNLFSDPTEQIKLSAEL